MDSSSKNKIYALVSISVIILTVASFVAAISFLLKINNLVFNVDQNIINEQTTELDKDGFENIKNKLDPERNNTNDKDGSIPPSSEDSSIVNSNTAIETGDSTNSEAESSPLPEASSSPVVKPTASPAVSSSPSVSPETEF